VLNLTPRVPSIFDTEGMNLDSSSVTIKLNGAWFCLICDLSLCSAEQMKEHSGGIRHAYQLAYIEAKGDKYRQFVIWRGIKARIPTYPSLYPKTPLPTIPVHEPVVAPHTSLVEQRGTHISPQLSSVLPEPIDGASFFDARYCNVIPVGQFYCEPCNECCSSMIDFIHHITSFEHIASLSAFSKLETDYFQPVLHPAGIFFIGLVSRSLVVDPLFFLQNQTALMLQWKIANRTPHEGSIIMQATPECMRAVLDRKPASFELSV